MKKQRNFLQSLNDAVNGFIYVMRHEKNMRVHFLLALLVLVSAVFLGVSQFEWILLCTAVTFVLVAEMMNTAIEETIDFIRSTFHPAARVIKHISAGIVLVSALNALMIGVLIFSPYCRLPLVFVEMGLKHSHWQITFVSLLVVIASVIAAKAFWQKKGTPFRGGAVSGHAAAAFSLWTAILFTQSNLFVIAGTLLLAILVAQSRLRAKIHSLLEVTLGGVLGILITSLFFQFFR